MIDLLFSGTDPGIFFFFFFFFFHETKTRGKEPTQCAQFIHINSTYQLQIIKRLLRIKIFTLVQYFCKIIDTINQALKCIL